MFFAPEVSNLVRVQDGSGGDFAHLRFQRDCVTFHISKHHSELEMHEATGAAKVTGVIVCMSVCTYVLDHMREFVEEGTYK